MNVNFGLFPPLAGRLPKKLRGAGLRRAGLAGAGGVDEGRGGRNKLII